LKHPHPVFESIAASFELISILVLFMWNFFIGKCEIFFTSEMAAVALFLAVCHFRAQRRQPPTPEVPVPPYKSPSSYARVSLLLERKTIAAR